MKSPDFEVNLQAGFHCSLASVTSGRQKKMVYKITIFNISLLFLLLLLLLVVATIT